MTNRSSALRYPRIWLYGLYLPVVLIGQLVVRTRGVQLLLTLLARQLDPRNLLTDIIMPYLIGVACAFYALFLLRHVSARAEKIVLIVGSALGMLLSIVGTLVGGLLGPVGVLVYGLVPFGVLLSLIFGVGRLIHQLAQRRAQ